MQGPLRSLLEAARSKEGERISAQIKPVSCESLMHAECSRLMLPARPSPHARATNSCQSCPLTPTVSTTCHRSRQRRPPDGGPQGARAGDGHQGAGKARIQHPLP